MKEVITENTAAELVGVSPRTLQRFAEAGYLALQRHMSGGRAYLKEEVIKLFGIAEGNYSPSTLPYSPKEVAPPNEPTSNAVVAPSDSVPQPAAMELNTQSPEEETLSAAGRKELLAEAQGKVLELYEKENLELRSQIEWLKKRLEWLEEKSERDQILIMSETQTIQKLVNLQEGRKSFGQLFLEWLGITPEPTRKLLPGTGQVLTMPERTKKTSVNE